MKIYVCQYCVFHCMVDYVMKNVIDNVYALKTSRSLWTRFQEHLSHASRPDGQMTKMLHVYRPRSFQKNLIWNEFGQWLRSSSVCKIPEVLIMPMDTPIMPPLGNDHDAAHLQVTTLLTRYVDSRPMSDVTPVTIWYIHPPHHDHTKVNIMVMNGWLTSLLFHVNWSNFLR